MTNNILKIKKTNGYRSLEQKKQKFKELAEGRVNRAISMIRLISNLGNKHHYDYTPEQAKKIISTLQIEIKNVQAKFNSKKRNIEDFTL